MAIKTSFGGCGSVNSIATTVVLRADPNECSEFIPEDAASPLRIYNASRALASTLGSTPDAGKRCIEHPRLATSSNRRPSVMMR
jgi:hypothetical protein